MTTTEIPVKIRTSEDTTAVPLLSVPYGTDLDAVIRLVGEWGISTPYGEFGYEELWAQFVVTPSGAFFELVVDVGGE